MWRDNEGVDWILIHVWRVLDEEKIVYFSVSVVYLAVWIRRYHFFAVIEVSSTMERGVTKYGL